ncbi:mannose-6-phosphate isomerase [Okibacterium sp. HSC-33S16]|uniref:mannose-6-phosphate isomerase, class I n=1 Tax=Okibacterium sp. HSC-33S16 TaxID=2910965 RepID=UPI0020A185C6|nr:mannose-6-phosphate isomerase, class I [Okibacterium sp. HSC-33S16]MCP2031696.1 mannose-6-phosphate isomerase [Okibacterium sp. HSC-33S16]
MFIPLTNTPRDYAWGSRTAIAELLGTEASGGPEAELWLGAHPGSPARILEPELTGGADTLAAWIDADPAAAGLREPRLPFLLKLLAADAPLSLQAHPSPAQALAGFERENAAGIPLDAPNRNYKDAFHKPELIVALSDTFDALCGFRTVADAADDVDRLLDVPGLDAAATNQLREFRARLTGPDADALRALVEHLLTDDVTALVSAVTEAAASAPITPAVATVNRLAEFYSGDPGIVVSLLLNSVTLRRGGVLYLPAGNIHAYLRGFGVELMAASDNVLRGGLTPKHIDVPELLSVLDFHPLPIPYLEPEPAGAGAARFAPDIPDFELVHVTGLGGESSRLGLPGPAIAIITEGEVTLAGTSARRVLTRGDVVYVTPDEGPLTVSGAGELFLATTRL